MGDYTKMTVEDIKNLIVEGGKYTTEELEGMGIKGKTQWVNFITNLEELGPDSMYQFEEDVAQSDTKVLPVKSGPDYCDKEWQDFVMSKFEPNELIDKKYPSVNGLRRVVELLLGEIISSGPVEVKTTMDSDVPGKAVVTYKVAISWKLGQYFDIEDPKLPVKEFWAVASSWHGNTDDMYAVFPESIAETRAEGRALRRALRLGVACADELTKKDTAEIVRQKVEKSTDGNWEDDGLIGDNQINSIKIMCDRLGIDVTKFINSGSKQYTNINEISKQTAINMIKRLNSYQNSSNDSASIPSNILLEN